MKSTAEHPAADTRQGIQSVEVAGPLLLALAKSGGPLPLSALAKSAGMPAAKAHRYLVSLIRVGLVEQDAATGLYDLGALALELGLVSLGRLDAVKLADETLSNLRDATGETVALATWGNFGPTYIRLLQSKRPVTVNLQIGSVMPMTYTASGLCFAAFLPEDTTEENIQARIRGTILMALSNKYGAIVLTTGNKSEMAVGYCTLYGDMAGGFAVIKDIAKTLVYRLCDYRNTLSEVIPTRILTRAPSAELRPNQTDQDSLPPYDVLDAIMQMYMEEDCSIAEIIAAGYRSEDVERVTRLIKINEYKRRQAPVGIRVTHRAFGRDWRYPITSRFRE